MLFTIFILLIFTFHKTSSLQCYDYDEQRVNYWIDPETIPSFPTEASLVEAEDQCTIRIRWLTLPKGKESFIDYLSVYSFDFLPKGSSFPFARVSIERDLESASTRTLIYSCTTDYCNNRTNLQQILSSLTLEENFASLDVLFSNDTAKFTDQNSCVNFSNATHFNCPPSASRLLKCGACLLLEMELPNEFCARCPEKTLVRNRDFVRRQVFFLFKNRTRLADQIKLVCRTKGCNALANVKKIHQLSKLEFNFNNSSVHTSSANSLITLSIALNLLLFLWHLL
jgi:hypothetical protein